MICTLLKEKFEDTKVVNRRRKSKKNRQHNGQKKKEKRIYKTLHRKLKIEQHEPHFCYLYLCILVCNTISISDDVHVVKQ
jgi:hypothetical protein